MRIRAFFDTESVAFSFLWKYQMAPGALVVLAGLLIAVFPEILVALVAATTMLIGVSLIGSAWRLRRSQQQSRGVAYVERCEW